VPGLLHDVPLMLAALGGRGSQTSAQGESRPAGFHHQPLAEPNVVGIELERASGRGGLPALPFRLQSGFTFPP
jgi:hypothetical protein